MNATEMLQNNMARELVAATCEYTGQDPQKSARAAALNAAFSAWATDDWIARTGNGNMTGKDWIRAAMKDGFQIPA